MKTLVFIASIALFFLTTTSNIFANGGSPPSRYGAMSCSASDAGYEEHWGGHSNCGDCLRKHGNCVERCNRDEFSCTAEGTRRDGRIDSVTAFDMREFAARDRALQRCYDSRLRGCRISNCFNNMVEVSSRSCR